MLTCQKCGRQWDYKGRGSAAGGRSLRTSCPSCHASVLLIKKPAPKFVSPSAPKRQPKEVIDFLLEKMGPGLDDSEIADPDHLLY